MPTRDHYAGDEPDGHGRPWGASKMVGHVLFKLIVLISVLLNLYLIGLLRHSPGSYQQLKEGGTAAYPGTITKASAKQLDIKTSQGTKRAALETTTTFALFPKDYQTLIPAGLPSSVSDIVAGTTEASVSVQLPYLKQAQALRVNLVRDDVLTGKVIEVSGVNVKFKGFAASGAKEETRTVAATATYQKLGSDGSLSPATLTDVTKDLGLYAFLDKPVSDPSGQITKLIVAEFSSSTAE